MDSKVGLLVTPFQLALPVGFNWEQEGFRVYTGKNCLDTMKVKFAQSCPTLYKPMDCPWNSLGQNTGVGSLSLLQGIFPTQGLNPGLPHCRQTLYQLSHKGSLATPAGAY